ncbi:MAG: hypothetical protein K2G25_03705 [Oscillospiraceae bacterium]|nr:hypothetical protein [Oscillospiraceae bacterium]
MKNDSKYTPTPQELSETLESLTTPQKLQLEAIMNMMAALLLSIHYAQNTQISE